MARFSLRKALGWAIFAAGLAFGAGPHWMALASGKLVTQQTLGELRRSWDLVNGMRWSVSSGTAYAPVRAWLEPSMNPLRAFYKYGNWGQSYPVRPSEFLKLVVLDAQGAVVYEREQVAHTNADDSGEFEFSSIHFDVFRVDRSGDYFLVVERLPNSELITFKSELSLRRNVRLTPPLTGLWIGLVVAAIGLAMAVKPVREARS